MSTLTEAVALRVTAYIKEQIDKIAKASHRKRSEILSEWINEKLEIVGWQIEKIMQGLEEANQMLFATEEDVSNLKKKWNVQ